MPPSQAAAPPQAKAKVKPSARARPEPAAQPEAPEKPKPRPKPIRPKQFVWAYPEEPPPDGSATVPLRCAPAVDASGRIYLHVLGKLLALEEEGGRAKVCWEYVTGSHAPGAIGAAPDGTIRVHCRDGLLHCVSFEGKQVYMPADVGEPLGYAAPIADADGNTWISSFDGGLIKVDADGRRQKPGPYVRSRQKFNAAGIIHQGVLYIGSDNGCLFAVELAEQRGTNRWNHAAGQGVTGWYIHSSPAITEEGLLVVAACDERLYGFAPNGKLVWKTEVPGQMLGSPVIDQPGQIYVGVSQSKRGQQPRGLLLCLDGNSHKIRWQYEAAGPVESTPVIGNDNTVYFGDNAGMVHAVDRGGQAQWTAKVEAPVRSAGTILAPRRVAFGLDNETLVVLKCASDALAAGGWPKIGGSLGQCGLKASG
ncbi:MAG: PQQ-like beta-propeller repeat protein [Pirellulales bacterium]|nr:PQQ-like beta-propeller repeat protein [Pirellulales bacterium]